MLPNFALQALAVVPVATAGGILDGPRYGRERMVLALQVVLSLRGPGNSPGWKSTKMGKMYRVPLPNLTEIGEN